MVTMDYVFSDDTDTEIAEDSTEATTSSPSLLLRTEAEQTTSNHSVQWLTEEGDILVPMTDHETTTMVRIGHVDTAELDSETTPRYPEATSLKKSLYVKRYAAMNVART
jgi:hypothetical protein